MAKSNTFIIDKVLHLFPKVRAASQFYSWSKIIR